MTKDVSANDDPFDLERVKTLMELMEKHGLTEVHLRRGDEQWRLRRGPQEMMQTAPGGLYPPINPYAAGPPPPQPPVSAAPPPPEEKTREEAGATVPITSPTVGTFYAAPSPDDPPFVSVGTVVQPDTVVCVVEAMKVFNQITADVSGTIVEVLVNNGDSVEFGQPLFRVRPG